MAVNSKMTISLDIRVTENQVLKLQALSQTSQLVHTRSCQYSCNGMTIPVTQALTRMNRASINHWQTPEEWKCANVSPIFKKGDKSRPSNYRLVFSTSVCCKDVEHIIHSDLMNLFKHHNILTDNQLRNKYPVIPNLYNNPGPHYGHKQQQSDWLLDLCSSAGCQLKCYGA